MSLTPEHHTRIAHAIATAETGTSGEIFCVLARSVSPYRDVLLGWAAGAALLLPMALIPLGLNPSWVPGLGETWSAGHLAATPDLVGGTLAAYAVCQAAIFLIVLALGWFTPLRRLMIPRAIRRERVHRAAMQQFLAHGLHVTQDRTGVLIFACLEDRHAEVIADESIHAKVDPEVWADALDALRVGMKAGDPGQGFEDAVRMAGAVLAQHFPPRPGNPNELADRLVII